MTAKHLGIPVELVLIENLRDPPQRAKLSALNPNTKIPVLEHGDLVLWESMAIMQYLADLTPGQTIYPTDLVARANVNRWLFWCAQHWNGALGTLTWENWMKGLFGAGPRDPEAAARGERDFAVHAKILDDHLASREWLAGPSVTIADFAIATPLMRVKEASIPLADYPRLSAWFARVEALPAWQATKP
jgi:glutathione S-transferase